MHDDHEREAAAVEKEIEKAEVELEQPLMRDENGLERELEREEGEVEELERELARDEERLRRALDAMDAADAALHAHHADVANVDPAADGHSRDAGQQPAETDDVVAEHDQRERGDEQQVEPAADHEPADAPVTDADKQSHTVENDVAQSEHGAEDANWGQEHQEDTHQSAAAGDNADAPAAQDVADSAIKLNDRSPPSAPPRTPADESRGLRSDGRTSSVRASVVDIAAQALFQAATPSARSSIANLASSQPLRAATSSSTATNGTPGTGSVFVSYCSLNSLSSNILPEDCENVVGDVDPLELAHKLHSLTYTVDVPYPSSTYIPPSTTCVLACISTAYADNPSCLSHLSTAASSSIPIIWCVFGDEEEGEGLSEKMLSYIPNMSVVDFRRKEGFVDGLRAVVGVLEGFGVFAGKAERAARMARGPNRNGDVNLWASIAEVALGSMRDVVGGDDDAVEKEGMEGAIGWESMTRMAVESLRDLADVEHHAARDGAAAVTDADVSSSRRVSTTSKRASTSSNRVSATKPAVNATGTARASITGPSHRFSAGSKRASETVRRAASGPLASSIGGLNVDAGLPVRRSLSEGGARVTSETAPMPDHYGKASGPGTGRASASQHANDAVAASQRASVASKRASETVQRASETVKLARADGHEQTPRASETVKRATETAKTVPSDAHEKTPRASTTSKRTSETKPAASDAHEKKTPRASEIQPHSDTAQPAGTDAHDQKTPRASETHRHSKTAQPAAASNSHEPAPGTARASTTSKHNNHKQEEVKSGSAAASVKAPRSYVASAGHSAAAGRGSGSMTPRAVVASKVASKVGSKVASVRASRNDIQASS
ncbi:hypothetical protein HK101_007230 [Irineochytrium annulatum]|nr:hypothetical protein HK101_007230 [Irineochytrium annulatum]